MPKRDHGPGVKDPERYEALREQGYSKEKSARIANTPRRIAGKRGGASPGYEQWTKDQLYDKAKQVGIDGRSHMSKQDLIRVLRDRSPSSRS
jgi:hypothetical protein